MPVVWQFIPRHQVRQLWRIVMKISDQRIVSAWAKELFMRRAAEMAKQYADTNERVLQIERQRTHFVRALAAMDVQASYIDELEKVVI